MGSLRRPLLLSGRKGHINLRRILGQLPSVSGTIEGGRPAVQQAELKVTELR